VDLGHQWACGIKNLEATAPSLGFDHTGDAMRREDHRGAIGHLVQFLHEHRTAVLEVVDDEAVVDDLVADVDRRAIEIEHTLHDLDGAVDAGAEAAGVSE
jgi:hypothetical protein